MELNSQLPRIWSVWWGRKVDVGVFRVEVDGGFVFKLGEQA